MFNFRLKINSFILGSTSIFTDVFYCIWGIRSSRAFYFWAYSTWLLYSREITYFIIANSSRWLRFWRIENDSPVNWNIFLYNFCIFCFFHFNGELFLLFNHNIFDKMIDCLFDFPLLLYYSRGMDRDLISFTPTSASTSTFISK